MSKNYILLSKIDLNSNINTVNIVYKSYFSNDYSFAQIYKEYLYKIISENEIFTYILDDKDISYIENKMPSLYLNYKTIDVEELQLLMEIIS